MRRHAHRDLCFALCAVFLLAGCGGGGGGDEAPSPGNGLLSGSFHYLYLGRDRALDTVYSETAIFEANGNGGLVFGPGWQTEDGVGTAIRRTNATYSIGGGRALRVSGGFPITTDGYVSADGRFGVTGVRLGGQNPGMLVFAKRHASPTLGTLVGEWELVEWFQRGTDSTDAQSAMADVVVTPAGVLETSNYFYNHDGDINPGMAIILDREIRVESDGTVTLRHGGSLVAQGGVSLSGDVILLGGREGNGGRAMVQVLIRKDRLGGVGSLNGTWTAVAWTAVEPGHENGWGSTAFDGDGSGTLAFGSNWEGTILESGPTPLGYGVSIDGEVSLVVSGANQWAGAGTSRIVVLSGGYAPDARPQILFNIR